MKRHNIGVDYLEYRFDLAPRQEREDLHKNLRIDVTNFPGSPHTSHFSLFIDRLDGDEVLAEELSILQLERLYDFIGLVLKLSKKKKGN